MGNCFKKSHAVSSTNLPQKNHKKVSPPNQEVSVNHDDPISTSVEMPPEKYSSKSEDICYARRRKRDVVNDCSGGSNLRYCVPKCRIDVKTPNKSAVSDAKVDDDINSRYIMGSELGRGEFGVTYLCADKFSGNVYACKSISKKNTANGKSVNIKDVRSEIRIMRRMPRHPNIVNLKDAYEDGSNFHIIMDLCRGGELFDRIVTQNHHSEHHAASIIKTIVQVVQVCHEHGVMHRDLKPENFLYESNKAFSPLKLIDFGVSTTFKPGD